MDDKDLRRAQNIAYRLLKYRSRSEKEIIKRLKFKKIPQDITSRIVRGLKEASLLDDREFTRLWVEERSKKGYGPLRIKKELREKGIESSLIDEFLCLDQEEDNTALIQELIRKRIKRHRAKSPLEIKKRLFYFLRNRGFSFSQITKALERIDYES